MARDLGTRSEERPVRSQHTRGLSKIKIINYIFSNFLFRFCEEMF